MIDISLKEVFLACLQTAASGCEPVTWTTSRIKTISESHHLHAATAAGASVDAGAAEVAEVGAANDVDGGPPGGGPGGTNGVASGSGEHVSAAQSPAVAAASAGQRLYCTRLIFAALTWLQQAFFVCVFAKTQGEKKLKRWKKLKDFQIQKLNVPVVLYNFSRKNSSFVKKTQDFR